MLQEGNHAYNSTIVTIDFGSLGFLLFIIFMSLKLTGIIDWSWFFITLPIWVPYAFAIAVWIIIALIVLFVYLVAFIADAIGGTGGYLKDKLFKKKNKK